MGACSLTLGIRPRHATALPSALQPVLQAPLPHASPAWRPRPTAAHTRSDSARTLLGVPGSPPRLWSQCCSSGQHRSPGQRRAAGPGSQRRVGTCTPGSVEEGGQVWAVPPVFCAGPRNPGSVFSVGVSKILTRPFQMQRKRLPQHTPVCGASQPRCEPLLSRGAGGGFQSPTLARLRQNGGPTGTAASQPSPRALFAAACPPASVSWAHPFASPGPMATVQRKLNGSAPGQPQPSFCSTDPAPGR